MRKDLLDTLEIFIKARDHLTDHPISGSARVTYNCAVDSVLRQADELVDVLKVQAVLYNAIDDAYKWFAAKRDRPSLCGMGHADYAKTLIVILEEALACADKGKQQ